MAVELVWLGLHHVRARLEPPPGPSSRIAGAVCTEHGGSHRAVPRVVLCDGERGRGRSRELWLQRRGGRKDAAPEQADGSPRSPAPTLTPPPDHRCACVGAGCRRRPPTGRARARGAVRDAPRAPRRQQGVGGAPAARPRTAPAPPGGRPRPRAPARARAVERGLAWRRSSMGRAWTAWWLACTRSRAAPRAPRPPRVGRSVA